MDLQHLFGPPSRSRRDGGRSMLAVATTTGLISLQLSDGSRLAIERMSMPLTRMTEQETTSRSTPPQQVVIRQGAGGWGMVISALILGGAAVYVINVWSHTQRKMIEAPGDVIQKGGEAIRKGIDSVREAAKDIQDDGGR